MGLAPGWELGWVQRERSSMASLGSPDAGGAVREKPLTLDQDVQSRRGLFCMPHSDD